jgi:hypothetical protein
MPIPMNNSGIRDHRLRGVEAHFLKQKNHAAVRSALERDIDSQAHILQGLTPEEIKIAEEASQ